MYAPLNLPNKGELHLFSRPFDISPYRTRLYDRLLIHTKIPCLFSTVNPV
ncbi:hypothetical protein [Haemophilus parahaemolyticus]|nr:hypothetical protein [Haemophilus parahaemolyticus]